MASEPTILNAEMQSTQTQGGNSGYALFIASGNETTFILPNVSRFIRGSTFVYVNEVYQSFTSYTETADCTAIIFNSSVANGVSVEIRYIKTFF